MKCVQVLPILKHTFSEELTYWTTHDFEIGDLIQIQLNHRNIYAVVSSIISLSEAKEFIKSRDFKIKKIETYTKVAFFSNAFIQACLHTSRYYVRSFGEVLSEYIPKKILENLETRSVLNTKQKTEVHKKKLATPIYVQKSFSERIAYIQELQKTYANICIVVPTDTYKKHIEHHMSDMTGVTILTPIHIYTLDEHDVDVCVLEYAGSEYYRHVLKGFDTRTMVRMYCHITNLQLIEMDSILPVYKHISPGDIETSPFVNKPEIHIVDQTISKIAKVQKYTPARGVHVKPSIIKKPEDDVDMRDFFEGEVDVVTHKKLKLISPELYSLIMYAQKQKQDILIYTTRKGLSSSAVCSDCGNILTCDICKKPYTLKKKDGVPTYTCPYAHTAISIDSTCPICGSIHIQGLGAGTDALEAELRDVVSMPIVVIDSDTTTPAKIRSIYKKRSESTHKPTIYIGTKFAIEQGLEEKFLYGGIASLETILALPNSSAELEAGRIIESMREKITHTLVIQTRTPSHPLWLYTQEKDWRYIQSTIQKESRELSLPPYTTHIQVYISKKHKKSEEDTQAILTYIQTYTDISIHHVSDDNRHVLHIYTPEWPFIQTQKNLYVFIKSLPKHIRVEVDSPSLM